MRPYLGILRDSFHEAFASRVLWILLILISLFLAGLAPLGTTEQARSHLSDADFIDRSALVKKLAKSSAGPEPALAEYLKSRLSVELKQKLVTSADKPEDRMALRAAAGQLRDELNALIATPDFFDAAAWDKVRLSLEARNLQDKGLDKLAADELARFNRLALEAAFPEELAASGRKQVQLSYIGRPFGVPLPFAQEDVKPLITQILLAFMIIVLGVFGIFMAIVVTASIIPHTYEQGAIDLLLSKPVSRSLVFLTKFFGGCSFIFIIATYLVGGMWAIVGWRFDLWNHKLLLCIPLFMFLFAIYYSISALAGVLWKNAIVCVVMTIVFWGTCFIVGVAHDGIDRIALNPTRIIKIVPAGQTLLAVNESGDTLAWDPVAAKWDEVFAEATQRRGPAAFIGIPLIGPVYDEKNARILAANQHLPQLAMFANSSLLVGKAAEDWKRIEGVATPLQTEVLLLNGASELLAIGARGVFRLEGNPEDKPKTTKILGFEVPMPGAVARFVEVTRDTRFGTPLSASLDRASGKMAVYDGHKLVVLVPQENKRFAVGKETEFEKSEAGLVGLAGDLLLLVVKSGAVRLYDPATLAEIATLTPRENSAPRYVTASPDGRWLAVVYHDGHLWMYDTKAKQPLVPSVTGQGDIGAITFAAADQLLVADRLTRVTEYNLENWQVVTRKQGPMNSWEMAYRYFLHPLYIVFPKPGALDNMVSYLLTDENTIAASAREEDLGATRMKIDIWGPIWSNLAFLSVVLAIGCVYVVRKDF